MDAKRNVNRCCRGYNGSGFGWPKSGHEMRRGNCGRLRMELEDNLYLLIFGLDVLCNDLRPSSEWISKDGQIHEEQ